jgi:hypothetical protein
MIRKSKKGVSVGRVGKAAMVSNIDYLSGQLEEVWGIVKPSDTRKLLAEVVDTARTAGDTKLMLQAARVMADFLKIAASTGVQMADIQRKMDSGVPDNQVNVQVNAVSNVPSVEEAQRELERYCDIVGPNGTDGRGLIGGTGDVDGEIPSDHIGRETGGRGGVDIGRIAILSPKDCSVPAERSPENTLP